jgi:aspartyl-tRNA(Asn)/glutamyl-tRNA(Gln) amidotransferase subunit A
MEGDIEPPVATAVRRALEALAREGAEIRGIDLPHAGHAVPAYYLVASAEASSNLARYEGLRYGPRRDDPDGERSPAAMIAATRGAGFGSEVKRRILLGTFALSAGYHDAFYLKAQKVRRLVQQDFQRAFEEVDVIAAPTSPVAAIRIGEKVESPVDMYRCDFLTAPASMAGIPALSIPCGLTENGIPLGLQLMGPALADGRVLRAARAFERTRTHREFIPPVAAADAVTDAEADAGSGGRTPYGP